MTDTALSIPERQSLDRYLPQSVKDLAWMANEVAKSGIYQNGNRALNGSECFVLMMKGAELGLTPMQSLNEISLIKGKPFVSKDVLTARILRSPRCQSWDPSDMDAKHCTIRFKVRGEDETHLTTTIEDIPQRYFLPSRSGEPSNWTLIPEDMLFGWTVRRIARRWFPEALLDIGDGRPEPIDETRVIDVARVERVVDRAEYNQPHSPGGGAPSFNAEACLGAVYLESSTKGGVYLRCQACGATFPPPQEVRDVVRGTPEHLTLAGDAEPVLEPGERIEESEPFSLESEQESAVQSDSPSATLDGEDVVAEPAAAEMAVNPELDAPDPKAANQAMRDAIYQHWILPRPTANKIEMRGLLDEFGWKGGESLGDWMLTLPDETVAKIADAVAAIP